MNVHLNITLDERLYRLLRRRAASKKMSAFIAEALKDKLGPTQAELEAAYRAAARERWRNSLADEWAATETEAWPD